jgi:flagellar hook-length control protein FliK
MTSPSAPSLNLLMPSGPSARAPRPEAGGGGDFSAWLNGGDAAAPPSNAVPRAPGGELTEAPRAEAPQLPPRKRTLPPQRAPERTPERALERTRAPSPQTLPPELDKPPPSDPLPPTAEDPYESPAAPFATPPASPVTPLIKPAAARSASHLTAKRTAELVQAPQTQPGLVQETQALQGSVGNESPVRRPDSPFGKLKDTQDAEWMPPPLPDATPVPAHAALQGANASVPSSGRSQFIEPSSVPLPGAFAPMGAVLAPRSPSSDLPAAASRAEFATMAQAGADPIAAGSETPIAEGRVWPSASALPVDLPAPAAPAAPELSHQTPQAAAPVADPTQLTAPPVRLRSEGHALDGAPAVHGGPLPSMPAATPGLAAESVRVQATLGMPLHDPDFAAALGNQLAVWTRDGVQSAELQLNPAELGPVQVRIQLDGTLAQVQFGAEQAQTREVLQQAMERLATALEAEGLQLQGGDVQAQLTDARDPRDPQRGAGPDGQRGSGQRHSQRLNGEADDAWQPLSAAPQAGRRGLLDLYA